MFRILIAEDDRELRQLFSHVLAKHGYSVVGVSNGCEALSEIEAGYFDLSEIETAVFEYNGKLTVLPKSEYRPLTPSDVNIPVTAAHIGTELIMDGKILGESLKRAGRDEKWLSKRLCDAGYTAKEIYLAIYKPSDDSIELYPIES